MVEAERERGVNEREARRMSMQKKIGKIKCPVVEIQ